METFATVVLKLIKYTLNKYFSYVGKESEFSLKSQRRWRSKVVVLLTDERWAYCSTDSKEDSQKSGSVRWR